MMSACVFRNTLKNVTHVFLKFENLPSWGLSNSHKLQVYYLHPSCINVNQEGGNIKRNHAWQEANYQYPQYQSLFKANIQLTSCNFSIINLKMFWPISPESNDLDLFYVEQSPIEPSPPRPNTSIALNSTEMSGYNTREMITLSSIASPEPQDVIIVPCSNLPTVPYGVGRQLPIYQSKHERSEPAAQSIDNLRNNGSSKPYSTRAWRRTKGPNHRSRRNRHRCRRRRWTSAQLRDGRHHILRRMTKHLTLMMNPREFICYPLVLPPQPPPRILKKNWASERLQGVWTVAFWKHRHPRPVVNKLKTQDWKFHTKFLQCFQYLKIYDMKWLRIKPMHLYVTHMNHT